MPFKCMLKKITILLLGDFCGHGIGKVFSLCTNILHYGETGQGMKLKKE